ncbi:NAD(P)-binding domain-containing protein [Leptospira sp. 96542]|nr:NAD(P)-binding domain-containing protein [Leptospira sp. 96542]
MFLSSYFNWLNNKAPQGSVEVYPDVSDRFETNLPGVFVIGDLTGVPLLKLATGSGKKVWDYVSYNLNGNLDAVIIGAGPSGFACAIEAKKRNKKYVVLEANVPFQTILSYPKGKPIFAEPKGIDFDSEVVIQNGTKESLLKYLNSLLEFSNVNLKLDTRVTQLLSLKDEGYEVHTSNGEIFRTNNVIIAIGKSGDPKRLDVPIAEKAQVYYRLIDPKESEDQNLVICGGGDTAIEATIACAQYAKSITLVYRGSEFVRPKQANLELLNELINSKKIECMFETEITEIGEQNLFLKTKLGSKKISYNSAYILIGSKAPIPFLKQLGVKIQSEKNIRDWVGFLSLLSFACLAYFGKAANYSASWFAPFATFMGGFSFLTLLCWSLLTLFKFGLKPKLNWNLFRNTYLVFVFFYFCYVYLSSMYFDFQLFDKYPSFHYTLLYSLTILVFGIRRMFVRSSQYIRYQTLTLIFIQIFFLFLLPELILPELGSYGLLGSQDGFLLTQVFPKEAYWKAYGFILAWPLSMGVLYDGGLTTFWLVYGFLFTFGFIPILVFFYGKGAYCGWICSCGGLAETLGDEHRHKMPHGKFAYKIEHSGQFILFFAIILTLLKLVGVFGKSLLPDFISLEYAADSIKWIYDLVVDIGLAGVVGVGFYFLFSGRIWCRMFCPLASLMHIYARFSQFRIFSDKKKCISCNVCTKNCHQGIDVMGYASRGIPMDSVQCVRCSACVSLCPTDVLRFGKLKGQKIKFDTLNTRF